MGSDLVSLTAPSQSLGSSKLGAPAPLGHRSGELEALGHHRGGELKPMIQENAIPEEESNEKKHRHHKHKKKKKKKKRRHRDRHKDSTTASDSMPAEDVEIAKKLVHNPSALLPPAEKVATRKKSRSPLDMNDVQPMRSKQVKQPGLFR